MEFTLIELLVVIAILAGVLLRIIDNAMLFLGARV